MIAWLKSLFKREITINLRVSGEINLNEVSKHIQDRSTDLRTEIGRQDDTVPRKAREEEREAILPSPKQFSNLQRPKVRFGTEE